MYTVHLSITLQLRLNKETGLKSEGIDLSSFLWIGVILESFHGVGKIPCFRELLKIKLNGHANIDDPSFSKRGLIRSRPHAFVISKFSKTSVTSCTEILIECSMVLR